MVRKRTGQVKELHAGAVKPDGEPKRIERSLAGSSQAARWNGGGRYRQSYGSLVELNTCRLILGSVGADVLADIAEDYLDLIETSVAIYEKNGDYALGIFASGWCRLLDQASRELCGTDDNREALAGGKWLCHESCWADAAQVSIEAGQPVDTECRGGLRLYALPIRAGGEIVGSISAGYGDPPRDPQKLREIGECYGVSVEELARQSRLYQSRPPFVVGAAKNYLRTSATLIGVSVENRRAREALQKSHDEQEQLVERRTAELAKAKRELERKMKEGKRTEEKLRQSREQLRRLAVHVESVREEERSRIAREIHDDLGQALTALKIDVRWLGSRLRRDQELLLEKTRSMSDLIDTTVQSVHRICADLRPGLLDELGLSAAMEWQANAFCERTGIGCEVMSEPEEIVVDRDCSTAVFRIFQETLTNIARHAQASRVRATLHKNPEELVLKVSDNGRGIREEEISGSRSFGIIGVCERVRSLGGTVEIKGGPNKGTTVMVRIPLTGSETR